MRVEAGKEFRGGDVVIADDAFAVEIADEFDRGVPAAGVMVDQDVGWRLEKLFNPGDVVERGVAE